ncbi:MAG: TolC family protein [bacterium]
MNWKPVVIWMLMAVGSAALLQAQTLAPGGAPLKAVPLTAEPLKTLRLSEALRHGAERWLRAPEFQVSAGLHQRREREAWRRAWLPSLSLSQTIKAGDLTSSETRRKTEARLGYSLYTGGRERAGLRAVQNARAAGVLEEGQARENLKLELAEAFLALLSSTRRIQSLRLTVEQAQTEFSNMKRRQELGLRTELEVIQARMALADERFKLQEEFRSRTAKAMSLSHLVRRPVAPEAELNADVAMDPRLRPLADYNRAALENHRGLTRLRRLLEQARHEQRRLDAADYPELELSTALTDFDGEDRTRSVALSLVYRFGGHRVQAERSETRGTFTDQDVVTTESLARRDQSLTSFGITFFDFQDAAADQASRQYQARFQRHQAARELVEAREARLREIQRRYLDLQSAMARVELEGMRVATSTLERNAYQRAYQGGNVRYEEWLERQNILNRNVLAEIDARGEVMLAWIGLLHESGLPLSK